MLYRCSFKVTNWRQTIILELWPFGLADLNRLLPQCAFANKCFIAVKHPSWPDGFHPPSEKVLIGKTGSRGMVMCIKNKIALMNVLRKPNLDKTVDLKVFLPIKPIKSKSEVIRLERSFGMADDSAVLKLWGGCCVHVHDGCKTYITLPRRSKVLTKFFEMILRTTGARFEKSEMAFLYDKLQSLAEPNCLILSWFQNAIYYRIMPAEVHNYENYDLMVGSNYIKVVEPGSDTGAGRN